MDTNIKSRLKTKKTKLLVFTLAVIIVSLVLYLLFGSITGIVVNAETEKPIEGAVVLVEWTSTHGIPGLTYHGVYKTAEKMTDKNGRFRFYRVLNPMIPPPDITIYKKGYVAWNNIAIFMDGEREDFKWKDGNVYGLARFKPEYSYVSHEIFVGSSIHEGAGEKQLFLKIYHEGELQKIRREVDEQADRMKKDLQK